MQNLKATLVRLTYNCDPTSLNEISQEDFADALENEFRVWNQTAELNVTFRQGASAISSVGWTGEDYGPEEYDALEEVMRRLGEEAFSACCRS